jgi:two-component system, OmpR family, sensor histidine kinase BaeS
MKFQSLSFRLIMVFLGIIVIGFAIAAGYTRWTTVREFSMLVLDQGQTNFITTVTTYYQIYGSWEGIDSLFQSQTPTGNNPPNMMFGMMVPRFLLVDQNDVVVVPIDPYRVGDKVPAGKLVGGIQIRINGQMVGTALIPATPELSTREIAYLARTNRALLIGATGAATLAILLGIFFTRRLTSPLRDLTSAIQKMSKGDLNQQVKIRSLDEIGELGNAFNSMSSQLAKSNQLRKQMTADIAHDLRTPLTVLNGYLEAMQDGVLPANKERFAIMYSEVQQLSGLVEDLRTLSLADAGELSMSPQIVSPKGLLEQSFANFSYQAKKAKVKLMVDADQNLPKVNVDPQRMEQVLDNLISNAIRYAGKGGKISLTAALQGDRIALIVEDNGEGISPDVLPHVFERFYRGDRSRNGVAGESGLGLAIAKSLIEAMGGSISATSEGDGKGSMFTIKLPVNKEK